MSELSNTQAGRIIDRLGQASPKDPGPLRAIGVSRDAGSPAILIAFNRDLSDAELRGLHERLTLIYTGRDDDAAPIPMRDGLPPLDPRCAWPFPDPLRLVDSEGGEPV